MHQLYKILSHSGIPCVVMLLLMACSSNSEKSREKENGIGLNAISLVNLSGEEIDMNDFKNKTVFINFWATWCKPCLQEMPGIERAQELLKDKDVVFLLASNESIEQIESFKANKRFNFEYVQVQNIESLNIQAIPATFIFNPQGELIFSEVGFRVWDAPENIRVITNSANQ